MSTSEHDARPLLAEHVSTLHSQRNHGDQKYIHEPTSGTALKGYAARSELCPRLLRTRENAELPLFNDLGSQAPRISKESRGNRGANASRFGRDSSRVGSLLLPGCFFP